MKKVELLKELPSNLPLEEAQQDSFDDEENFDLDFELEELESRLAMDASCPWGQPAGAKCIA